MGYTRTYHNPCYSAPSSHDVDDESVSLLGRFGNRTGVRLSSIPENPTMSEGTIANTLTHDRAAQRRNHIFTIGVGITVMTAFFGIAFRPPPQHTQNVHEPQQYHANHGQVMSIEGTSTKTSDLSFMGIDYDCQGDDRYSKNTVKTAYELPFAALFKDNRGQKKFEASSVTMVDGNIYAICDNSWAISKFDPSLTPFSANNVQIGDPYRENGSSGYEAIFHHNNTFYVVRESVEFANETSAIPKYHAIIEELTFTENDYIIGDQCRSDFEFEGASKGFEGAIGFPGTDGAFYVLGLCEGNHCSESKKKKFDSGQGRIVLMRKKTDNGVSPECVWETIDVVKIPESAHFKDYSDIDVTLDGRVVITTQEDSALWIGQLRGVVDGILDPYTLTFDEDIGRVYSFPKSTDCQTIYCNIEGIQFLNDEMLIGVSDKMKSRGKQDYRCLDKDQSIHAFVLP